MSADERIVEALAGHKPEWRGSPEEHAVLWCCTCDEYRTREYASFLGHLAAVIEPIVREREFAAMHWALSQPRVPVTHFPYRIEADDE